jgi:hypothetical protein
MRLVCASILSHAVLTFTTRETKGHPTGLPGPSRAQILFSVATTSLAGPKQAIRTPPTEAGQPGNWPQLATKKTVDVTALKTEAKELLTMSQALPAQMEQIGNGKYPKELVDNLKRIEKLSKHIRGEIE